MDTASLIISVLGLVIAAIAIGATVYVGMLTIKQGRVISNIETREHEWEQEDRRSAHIQVNVRRETTATGRVNDVGPSQQTTTYLQLKNTGRSTARDLVWQDSSRKQRLFNMGDIKNMKELHPGEAFDLSFLGRTMGDTEIVYFDISWTDGRGHHSKRTILNA